MNKVILGALIVLLATQAIQGQLLTLILGSFTEGILSSLFSVFGWTINIVFDVVAFVSLFLSPITLTVSSTCLNILSTASPGLFNIANAFSSSLSTISSTSNSIAAAITSVTVSQAAGGTVELIGNVYQTNTQVLGFLIVAALSASSGISPNPSPFHELNLPSSAVSTSVGNQTQVFLLYIQALVARVNQTGQEFEDLSSAVNTTLCNCPNTTTVQNVIDQWNNVSSLLAPYSNSTLTNTTLIKLISSDPALSGNLTAAITALNALQSQQAACALCLSGNCAAGNYVDVRKCYRAAASCQRRGNKSIKRNISNNRRKGSYRRNRSKRAKASRQRRVKQRGEAYTNTMGKGINYLVSSIQAFRFVDLMSSFSSFAQSLAYFRGNSSAIFQSTVNNVSIILNTADENITTYQNTQINTIIDQVSTLASTIINNTLPGSGFENCTVFASYVLQVFSFYQDELQKCNNAANAAETAIFVNVTNQLVFFGRAYNFFVQSSDSCFSKYCSSWLCTFWNYFTNNRANIPAVLSCQSSLQAIVVTNITALQTNAATFVSDAQNNANAFVAANKNCTDTKTSLASAMLSLLNQQYQVCMNPGSTTTAAPTTTTTTTPTTTTTTPTTTVSATTTKAAAQTLLCLLLGLGC